MNDKEEWRPIPDYPDYEVSSEGRVRSYRPIGRARKNGPKPRAKEPTILKGWLDSNGYRFTCLYNDSGREHRTHIQVHLLVARAFLGDAPEDSPDVQHKNDDRADNRVSNLHYQPRSKTRGRCEAVSDEQVRQIRAQYKGDAGPEAQKAVAKQYGIATHTAYCILTGRTRKNA